MLIPNFDSADSCSLSIFSIEVVLQRTLYLPEVQSRVTGLEQFVTRNAGWTFRLYRDILTQKAQSEG